MNRTSRLSSWMLVLPLAVRVAAGTDAPVDDSAAVDDADLRAAQHEVYQKLAKQLIDDGNVDQAQQVLQLLKERELADELAPASAVSKDAHVQGDTSRSASTLSNLDRKTYSQYYVLREQQAAIGWERDDLETKQRLGTITAAESERLDAITTRVFPQINAALSHFFGQLQEQLLRDRAPGQLVPDLKSTGSRMRTAVTQLEQVAPTAHAVGLQYLWNSGQLTIILVTAGAPPIVRQVPIERPVFEARVHTARELLRMPQSDPARVDAALIALYALLVAPIQGDLHAAGAHTLMILPDDFLRSVPFAALTDGKRYLIQDYALTLFSDALTTTKMVPTDSVWKVVGMGSTRAVGGFPALPAVSDELGKILRQPGISGVRYLDDQFNHEQLTRSLDGDFNVLHIASHFILQPGHPEASRLYLGDRSQLSLEDLKDQDLRFDYFDLVTFSACETGVGAGVGEYGQELEGLAARVQEQGAHAVMASLWKVYDASTSEFMQDFYRAHGEKKLNKAESLRAAQLDFIEGAGASPQAAVFRRPYYWAPFVLLGSWQ
jgi:CHAT domain-containing protein